MRSPRAALLGPFALLAVLACGSGGEGEGPTPTAEPDGSAATAPASVWFEDRMASSGIDFVHASGAQGDFHFPEIMGGGAGLFDHDDDGDLDLYLVQSGTLGTDDGPENQLYANLGGLRFENVTEATGAGHAGYGMGCAVADVEGDGDPDLFVTNVGADVLLRNGGAGGRFAQEGAESGLEDAVWSTSAAFLDHDRDGDLDLFVTNYVVWSINTDLPCRATSGARVYCSPLSFQAPLPDTLYENRGDGTFEDVSEAAGLRKAFGNGLGVACGDFDRDGRVDVYVANDGTPNQLWANQGDGTFRDAAFARSCAVNAAGQSEAGMGVQAADVDQDEDLDLFLSHLRHQTNTLYHNQGAWFEDMTASAGLGAPSYADTGFGLGFHDFDLDGRLDLYIANGRVVYWDPALDPDDAYAEPNRLFAGLDGPRFEVVPRAGRDQDAVHTSRAAAFGDLDDDGDVDIVVVNRDARPYLLENVAERKGSWIGFRVLNENGQPALHAELRIETGDAVYYRRVDRAYGYCTSNDPRAFVGLRSGADDVRAVVTWPDGARERFPALVLESLHELRRGSGEPVSGSR